MRNDDHQVEDVIWILGFAIVFVIAVGLSLWLGGGQQP